MGTPRSQRNPMKNRGSCLLEVTQPAPPIPLLPWGPSSAPGGQDRTCPCILLLHPKLGETCQDPDWRLCIHPSSSGREFLLFGPHRDLLGGFYLPRSPAGAGMGGRDSPTSLPPFIKQHKRKGLFFKLRHANISFQTVEVNSMLGSIFPNMCIPIRFRSFDSI